MKKVLLFIFDLAIFFVVSTPVSYAQLECETGNLRADPDNPQTYMATACIGGFTSKEEVTYPVVVKVNCLDRSGLVHLIGDQCSSFESQTYTPTLNNIAYEDRNSDGIADNYFTCFDIQGINRDVGKLNVEFTSINKGVCTTESIETLPKNYDFWYEHIRRTLEDNSGYNTGENLNSPFCVDGRINTAIGCISYDVIGFTKFLLGWAIGVGGGVSLIMVAYSGMLYVLSKGDPNKTNDAKSILTSSILGLLLIIFAVTLLRIIGVNLLDIL